jgi:DNA-binding PadR family transcriptional regulator
MPITNKELAILGLISEAPKYGYQIEQDIEARGMREWTEIGFSSIYYVLNKLEKKGLLSSKIHTDGKRPARRIYELTPKGMEMFSRNIRERLSNPRPYSGDLDLGLANQPALPLPQVVTALMTHRDTLAGQITRVQEKWAHDSQPHLPDYVHALFEHSTSLMQAEFDWLESYIRQLENRLLDQALEDENNTQGEKDGR